MKFFYIRNRIGVLILSMIVCLSRLPIKDLWLWIAPLYVKVRKRQLQFLLKKEFCQINVKFAQNMEKVWHYLFFRPTTDIQDKPDGQEIIKKESRIAYPWACESAFKLTIQNRAK